MTTSASLSTRIVLLVICISVISVIALASISISISQQALKKDAGQRLNLIASDRMQTLKSIWDLQTDQVETVAADPNIISVLRDTQINGSSEKMKQAENALQKFLNSDYEKSTSIATVQLLDGGWKLVSGNDKNSNGQNDADFALQIVDNYQHERLDFGLLSKPFYQVAYNENHAAAVLVIIAPVFEPDSTSNLLIKEPKGYLVVMKDIENANSILGDKRFMGETGESYLVDRNGLMLTTSRFDKDARYRQVISSIPVESCFHNGADINAAQYTNYEGKLVFGASQCERNIGILLLSEQGNSELFAPIVSLQERYLLITLGIIAAAGLVSFHLSVSILKPLQELRKIMKNVQSGTFQKADINRGDEIGELSNGFNSMVDELEIRAKKLKERNDMLEVMTAKLDAYAKALVKADKDKEEFSTMISDELKRFVIPIIGYCELILDGSLGEIGKRPKEKIEIMLEQAWSLQNLVQNIIDVRKLDSGMLRMNMQRNVSAGQMVQQCLDKVRTLQYSKEILINVEVDDRITLECDPHRTLQMLENLVEHSIRRTLEAKKSKMRIIVGLSGATGKEVSVNFIIEDEGSVISEQQQKNILENKFYNIDTSFTRDAGITDVRTIIARSIIDAHKGKIAIKSEDGRFTRFTISLPLSQNISMAAAG